MIVRRKFKLMLRHILYKMQQPHGQHEVDPWFFLINDELGPELGLLCSGSVDDEGVW